MTIPATTSTRAARVFARIRAADRPEVWISLRTEEDVRREAEQLDVRLAAGETLPLAGLFAAVKDNIDVEGLPTTGGSRGYSFVPAADATAVKRLRDAGAIVIGKTNLDQFATGLVGTRSPFGAVRNAWDPTRISGGSSSGSAVAVALSLVDIALGTDTAGSGRVPAALNGIVGVKLTRGLIPTTGVIPACRSLDCVTVFARDLALASRTADLLSGDDGKDPLARTDAERAAHSPVLTSLPGHPVVAVPTREHLTGLADGWLEAFDLVVDRLRSGGATIVEVDIAPLLDAASLLYNGAFVAERYAAVGSFLESHRDDIGADLDPSVAGIILGSADRTAVALFDDRERLDELAALSRRLLDGCAALLTPTTAWHPTLDQVADDPIGANSRMGRYTNFANLLDQCSIAVPGGTVSGLPFGVMLTAPAFHDGAIAQLAERIIAPSVEVFVIGAHLLGQPLNYQLVAGGGTLLESTQTAANYQLFALDTVPPKPGMVRTAAGGSSVRGELWSLPASSLGTLVATLPAPLSIGNVVLSDGRNVPGFLCEPIATEGAEDISAYGGWLAWRTARTE